MRRAPAVLSTSAFTGRLAAVLLLATVACSTAVGLAVHGILAAQGRSEIVRRTTAAARAASLAAGADVIAPLSTSARVGSAAQSLADDAEVRSVLVLAADGTVLAAPTRTPEPAVASTPITLTPGADGATASGSSSAPAYTAQDPVRVSAGSAATTGAVIGAAVTAADASDVARALQIGGVVTRTGGDLLVVTVPLHDAGTAAALQVVWEPGAVTAGTATAQRTALVAVVMGASALVPVAGLLGGWWLLRRYRLLFTRSRTDEATGLALRSVFQDDLARHAAEGLSTRHRLVLVLVDLNGVTMVNDHFGRRRGDALVTTVGALLRRTADERPASALGVYRVAGDCFALLLRVSSTDEAMVVADRVRRQVALEAEPFTANLGLAVLDGARCTDGETLLIAADAALHEARALGGNRVVVSGDPGSGLRWEVGSEAADDLLRALQAELDALTDLDLDGFEEPEDPSPGSLDLRDRS